MRPVLPGLLAAVLALTACGADPDYYLLPPPAPGSARPAAGPSVAVADIGLPAYAEAMEIATLTETGAVTLDEEALWADTPSRALTRHLVTALQARLASQVGTEPWPGFDGPALRVEVITDRLIGRIDGSVEFSGQYVVVAPSSGAIRTSQRFAIDMPAQGTGYQGLLATHARAVERLADQIAASITGVGVAS